MTVRLSTQSVHISGEIKKTQTDRSICGYPSTLPGISSEMVLGDMSRAAVVPREAVCPQHWIVNTPLTSKPVQKRLYCIHWVVALTTKRWYRRGGSKRVWRWFHGVPGTSPHDKAPCHHEVYDSQRLRVYGRLSV